MLTLSGIAIIALAWLLQLSGTSQGRDRLEQTFILTYGIGTALMLVDAASYGFSVSAWMHLIVLLIVGLLYIKMHK